MKCPFHDHIDYHNDGDGKLAKDSNDEFVDGGEDNDNVDEVNSGVNLV